jgi:hypothetical protein
MIETIEVSVKEVLIILAVYLVLVNWVLPRLGVPT